MAGAASRPAETCNRRRRLIIVFPPWTTLLGREANLSGSATEGQSPREVRVSRRGAPAPSAHAALDARQGLVDLVDQLARPVAGAQFQGAIGFDTGAVGDVGLVDAALGQA